jgi:hypothetical protein
MLPCKRTKDEFVGLWQAQDWVFIAKWIRDKAKGVAGGCLSRMAIVQAIKWGG